MNVLINHEGKTNAEIIGADIMVCQIKTNEIMGKIEHKFYKTAAELFIDILTTNGLNDAEKLIVFHTVSKIMEPSVIILQLPKPGGA